jgi:hypothetical protein
VEDDVAELAQVALLRRDLGDVAVVTGDPAPAAQPREAAATDRDRRTSAVACFGSRLRLRGAGTGVVRRLRTCSIIRGVRQPTSEMNSST